MHDESDLTGQNDSPFISAAYAHQLAAYSPQHYHDHVAFLSDYVDQILPNSTIYMRARQLPVLWNGEVVGLAKLMHEVASHVPFPSGPERSERWSDILAFVTDDQGAAVRLAVDVACGRAMPKEDHEVAELVQALADYKALIDHSAQPQAASHAFAAGALAAPQPSGDDLTAVSPPAAEPDGGANRPASMPMSLLRRLSRGST